MKLSIIIPTYNRLKTLSRAIDSVYSQSVWSENAFELIVVDDGSTDGTESVVSNQYPLCTLLTQENKGVSSARNLGLSRAKGEWIAFLDSDDEWLPHKLARQLVALDQSQLKICHTQEIWVRDGRRVNQMNKHRKSGGYIFDACLPLCAMSPSSIVIHRDIFNSLGSFDESLPACEDYDLWLRICAANSVAYVEEPCIIKYGGHEDQLSRTYWGMDRFRVRSLENLLLSPMFRELSASSQKLAIKTLTNKNRILLNGALKRSNQELVQECQDRIQKLDL
ncbi:MAG: glycosyltransferase [Gammaproteobacteria bacterium]|nr:glycosyltransferase [Gammaproteobacteria bacterium]